MNERQEQTADVLGKLTVLGTIVLPMNIITGMWGMNVKVPGQDINNQFWFWSSELRFPSRCTNCTDKKHSHVFFARFRHLMLLYCETGVRDCLTGEYGRLLSSTPCLQAHWEENLHMSTASAGVGYTRRAQGKSRRTCIDVPGLQALAVSSVHRQ